MSPVQKFSDELRPVSLDILDACDGFYTKFIIGTVDVPPINELFATLNAAPGNVDDWHVTVFGDVCSKLISAGIGAHILPAEAQTQIALLNSQIFREFYRAGRNIAALIIADPVKLLRVEIYGDVLYRLVEPMNLPDVLAKIWNPLIDLEKVFVPFSFLDKVHRDNLELLSPARTLAEILPPTPAADEEQPHHHKISNLRNLVFDSIISVGHSLLQTNSSLPTPRPNPPDPFGFNDGSQKLPMVPNLLDRPLSQSLGRSEQLDKSTKKWIICKAAIKYMYENPVATIEDAAEAAITIVNGMLSENDRPFPLGYRVESCKAESIEILHVLHARQLCQVGRWADHLPVLRTVTALLTKQTAKRYFYPDVKYLGPVDAPQIKPADLVGNTLILASNLIPVISRRLIQFNNWGAGNCGIYSTLFQSRHDLVKWLKTKPQWSPFLPQYLRDGKSRGNLSMHGQLNGIGTCIQRDGYLERTGIILRSMTTENVLKEARDLWQFHRTQFLELPPAEQAQRQKLHPGGEEWNERKVLQRYGSALLETSQMMGLDFGFISALHCRPIHLWQVKGLGQPALQHKLTDTVSPENLAAIILPDGSLAASCRARPISFWGTQGHYMFLNEICNYLDFLKILRHQQAGAAV
ncbi:MAG: hypothetical protein LBI20_02095 [Holosporales bacterium]|nr:hypothetical protein [Holosporales bacterium]